MCLLVTCVLSVFGGVNFDFTVLTGLVVVVDAVDVRALWWWAGQALAVNAREMVQSVTLRAGFVRCVAFFGVAFNWLTAGGLLGVLGHYGFSSGFG